MLPLIRRLAPLLAPALLLAMVGCRGSESPTEPAPGPALDITAAATLSFRQVT